MAEVIKVTKDNFENEVLGCEKPVLADFNADWCGPCRMLKPVLDDMAKERQDVKIVSINVDDEGELAQKFEIFSIPCVIAFKDGKEVGRSVGFQPRSELERLIVE